MNIKCVIGHRSNFCARPARSCFERLGGRKCLVLTRCGRAESLVSNGAWRPLLVTSRASASGRRRRVPRGPHRHSRFLTGFLGRAGLGAASTFSLACLEGRASLQPKNLVLTGLGGPGLVRRALRLPSARRGDPDGRKSNTEPHEVNRDHRAPVRISATRWR